jgi:hypothetical protein
MVLSPTSKWEFRLADVAFEGQLYLKITRGNPPAGAPTAFDVLVSAGVVKVDATKFAPGRVYAYRLLEHNGREVSTGEFSVLGISQVETLKRLAAERVKVMGLSEQAAWLDTLAANKLDWDVLQLTVEH